MKWFVVVLLATGAVAVVARNTDPPYRGQLQNSYSPHGQGNAQLQYRNPANYNSDSSNSQGYAQAPHYNQANANGDSSIDQEYAQSQYRNLGNYNSDSSNSQGYAQAPHYNQANANRDSSIDREYAQSQYRNPGNYKSDSSNSQGYAQAPHYNQANANEGRRELDLFDDEYVSESAASRLFVIKRASILSPPNFAFFAGGSSPDETYTFEEANRILKNSKFDKSKTTVIYIHGYLEGLYSDSVKAIVKTYTERNDHNIIILDWQSKALPGYLVNAVPNVNKVGQNAAQAILDIINSGLSVNQLHIVGHSLGGQMAGVIGRTIQELSRGSVVLKRISALDPAFPGFYGIPGVKHLTADDAEYVDVLHTDFGVYGAPVKTGTVDFWPNGGLHPQPGCLINVCSHQRSWVYWTESLNTNAKNQFLSTIADSWSDFKNNPAQYDPNVVMGYSTRLGLSGSYYLRTDNKFPYALGSKGLTYE